MHKPAPTAIARIPNQLLACATAGLMLGQVVLGLATQHDGALLGLVCALVFVVCGGAGVLLALLHLHGTQQPVRGRGRASAPLQAWALSLAVGVLGSIQLGSLLLA